MFIYKYNYAEHNEQLVKCEMESIFKQEIATDTIFTDYNISPNKSYFINYKIEIMCSDVDIQQLLVKINDMNLYYEKFKIEFIDVKTAVMEYKERIGYCIQIADLIDGYGIMSNPDYTFVVTRINGMWYFGELTRNNRRFELHQDKPHSYSNAMSCELSRSLINILCEQDMPTIIDPCCGIGTVVIEALSQGYDIEGTEMNVFIAEKDSQNLEFLKLKNVIKNQDMHDISKVYDVAILDIPYGLMSSTSTELQTGLISKCYEISSRMLLVASEPSEDLVANTQWNIEKQITAPKANSKFERYIYILNK